MLEYGGTSENMPDTNVYLSPAGFKTAGNGLRYDLDSYKDLITWTDFKSHYKSKDYCCLAIPLFNKLTNPFNYTVHYLH